MAEEPYVRAVPETITPRAEVTGRALMASLDPTITTEAIRVLMGLHGLIAVRKKNHPQAWISLDEVYAHTGVKPETVGRHTDSLARLGLAHASDGAGGALVEGHGLASGWTYTRSAFAPIKCDPALGAWLHPADEQWAQDQGASSGYRLALVLMATCPTRTTITTTGLAEVLGKDRTTITRGLQRLAKVGPLVKDGNRWLWLPEAVTQDFTGGEGGRVYRVESRFKRLDHNLTRLYLRAEADRETMADIENDS